MPWADALNSLLKAECIRSPVMRPKGGMKLTADEIAVAEYADWFDHRRLYGEIGLAPASEFEATIGRPKATERHRENPVLTEV